MLGVLLGLFKLTSYSVLIFCFDQFNIIIIILIMHENLETDMLLNILAYRN